jgi:hypothetical protein
MPVSNISTSVDCSSNGGAWRWIDQRSSAVHLPSSSTGSPMTLRIRPSVARPTGTVIGCAGVDRLHAADHAVGRLHGDAAHLVLAEVLGDLGDDVDRDAFPSSPSSST